MSSRPELKVEDEGGFIRFYKDLPAVGNDTVRVFDRGDWYTAHGDNANFIAKTVYKSTSVVRQLGRNDHTGLPSVTMTTTVFRQFLRECLVKLGKRVEIWASSGGRMNWKITKHASPGNLQDVEEELGGQFDASPMILAVKVSAATTEARTVGVCFADASVRELGVGEFLDNDLYSNLEALVIQLGIKECLLQIDKSDKDHDLAKLRQVIDRCGISIGEKPASDFNGKDIEQDLSRLLKDERLDGLFPQDGLRLAMGAASALIKYLDLLQVPGNFGQYRLYQHELANYMRLDASALKALNLVPGPRDGAKNMSVYGVLNHCKTPLGSRLLSRWLMQPLLDKDEIEKRQTLVAVFADDTETRQSLQEEHLRAMPDLYRLAKRFQRKKANLEDVVRAYNAVNRIPGIIFSLESVMEENAKDALDAAYIHRLRKSAEATRKLQQLVEETIDLEALDHHEYIIKADFDDRLRTIRKRLEKMQADISAEFLGSARDLGHEPDKKIFLECHRVHGYCMRLTRQESGCIRNRPQYQEISTQKNGVYFSTKKMLTLRREYDQMNQNYNSSQANLVQEVVDIAATYSGELEKLGSLLAHLDVVVSLAHCSVNAPTPYVRPRIHARGEGKTVLREARHPCMELQDDLQYIANDVELDRESSSFLIITGPNMGGKSTYIRQIGVIALMAQIGCFVPCAEAELTIFDSILARVGASDSQLRGVSTFMAEMLETANILKSATAESLIIIDELGRGTSTYDGFGLAWAISEHIVKEIRCFGLFATHFHELTALADQYPQVRNLHVTAHVSGTGKDRAAAAHNDNDNDGYAKREVTLLYKVKPGICDQSFGIHVAELVRFPDRVVRMARRKADELEDFSSKHDDSIGGFTKEDMEEGSALLKDMLTRWKEEVKAGKLGTAAMIDKMRELAKNNPGLVANPFFQSLKAL